MNVEIIIIDRIELKIYSKNMTLQYDLKNQSSVIRKK